MREMATEKKLAEGVGNECFCLLPLWLRAARQTCGGCDVPATLLASEFSFVPLCSVDLYYVKIDIINQNNENTLVSFH